MDRRAMVFFALTSVFFGGTFVGAKAGLTAVPPLLLLGLRFDVAAIVLGGYVLWRYSPSALRPRTRDDLVGILATGFVAVGVTNALIFVGQQYVTSGVSSIITSLNPILTPVFAAALVADEELSRQGAFGMLIGLVGVALVVSPDPAQLMGGAILGKVLVFGAAITGALGSVLIRWADSDLSASIRTAWGVPIAAVFVHLLSAHADESIASVVWTPTAIASIVYLGVFAGGVAYITYFTLIDTTGVIRANLVFYLVPVIAALGGWLLLGESITMVAIVGFFVIFAGFAVIGSEELTYRELERSMNQFAS